MTAYSHFLGLADQAIIEACKLECFYTRMSSLIALACPIPLANFTARTLYSWLYCLIAAISSLFLLLITPQILKKYVSTFYTTSEKDACTGIINRYITARGKGIFSLAVIF